MSGGFFKDLDVTYWTNSIYNADDADMDAVMEETLETPLVDNALNYVCAIERLEISGNGIPYYDVSLDDDKLTNAMDPRPYTQIQLRWSAAPGIVQATWTLQSRYYTLQDLIQELTNIGETGNFMDAPHQNDDIGTWSLGSGGTIDFTLSVNAVQNLGFLWDNVYFLFTSETLASIFGLPADPPVIVGYGTTYGMGDFCDSAGGYKFRTKYSRIDAGNIPSIIQVRTNLPFESDQVNSARTNIATDFALAAASSISYNYIVPTNIYPHPTTIGANINYPSPVIGNYGWSFNNGGVILYNPNERRWLNFSAPTPVTAIRIWVEYVLNDGETVRIVPLPKGCKFSIKLGFYKKENL